MDTRSPSEHDCERAALLIDDRVDGALSPADGAELEAHLAGCAKCRSLAGDIEEIRRAARELPVRSPRGNAWERIAERLEAEGPLPVAATRRAWASTRVLLPIAAALLLAVGASLAYLAGPWGERTTAGGSGASVHESADDLVRSIDQELRLAESHYENAIAGLEKIAADGQGTLAPDLAATLQKNLGIIDQAIDESRQALASQPDSTLAQTSLFEAFRRKVSLLEDTIALINVMRKGDHTGAARVIEGITKS